MTFSQINIAPEASLVLITLFLTFAAGCAQVSTAETDLLALENQRYQAMVETDLEWLDSMLDDDLVFTHASGKIDSKASFLDGLRSGTLVYRQIKIEDTRVRMYGTCGIVTGRSFLDISVQGEDRKLQLRFTTVWVEDQAHWKVVAYQSTRDPAGG